MPVVVKQLSKRSREQRESSIRCFPKVAGRSRKYRVHPLLAPLNWLPLLLVEPGKLERLRADRCPNLLPKAGHWLQEAVTWPQLHWCAWLPRDLRYGHAALRETCTCCLVTYRAAVTADKRLLTEATEAAEAASWQAQRPDWKKVCKLQTFSLSPYTLQSVLLLCTPFSLVLKDIGWDRNFFMLIIMNHI